MNPLRLAVIGGGVIGSKHAELISIYQGTELVGISDIDETVNAVAQRYQVGFYNKLEDLLISKLSKYFFFGIESYWFNLLRNIDTGKISISEIKNNFN